MAIDLGYLLLYNSAAILTVASTVLDDALRWVASGKAYPKKKSKEEDR